MAKARRAKTTTKKSTRRTKARTNKRTRKKKNNIDKNLIVVVMIITSLLLCVLIYTKSGWMGEHLSPTLGGIMGWIKYIIPIGTLAMAIKIATDDKEYLSKKIINYIIFILCITATMTICRNKKGTLSKNMEFSKFLEEAYELGTKNVEGGAIGAIIAIPLCKFLGTIGRIILLIGIAIIKLINLFEIKPAEIIKNIVERTKERREYEEDDDEEEIEDKEKTEDKKLIIEKKDKKKKKKKEKEKEEIPIEEQITINLNETEPKKKKLNQSTKKKVNTGTKEKPKPNQIEANLFKQEQEKKEEKTKEVLVLEHGLTEEEENYEFPPIELLQRRSRKFGNKRWQKSGSRYGNKITKNFI